MKPLPILAALFSTALLAPLAEAVTLFHTDLRIVSDETTAGALGTVTRSNADLIEVRSRATTSQNALQIATFLQYDVSSLTIADVNNAGFSAIFEVDYTTQLNTSNQLIALIGRNTGGTWDSSGTNNPLHDWGWSDEPGTIAAADSQTLQANIVGTTPPVNDIQIDVSAIVKGWVDGSFANQGFVLFYDRNAFQAAGFSNPELQITVPEPGSFALLLTGVVALGLRRRR